MTGWTRGEIAEIWSAVRAAPSVHNTQPWVLEFHDDNDNDDAHGVSLFENLSRALPRHDPYGRDRRISCGAAVSNLLFATRILGWEPELELLPSPAHPDEIARMTAYRRRQPSDVELARYAVIHDRHSYRQPFTATRVDATQRNRLVAASHTSGVELRPIPDEGIAVLAKLLGRAAVVLRADRAYQRELSAWTALDPQPPPGGGIAAAATRTLPWTGLVRRTTAIPDTPTLTHRLHAECLLLVLTPDDGRADQVHAGMAAQTTWLAAVADGLAGSVLTQPFQLAEIRAGLIEGLTLPGFPQALLRFGYPTA